VTGPVRTKFSARFIKSLAKIGEPIASRAATALERFHDNPEIPGLNFEAFKDRPGFFTIRVGRNFRILLKEEADEDGPYFLLADISNHDDTYS
jgi:mRNA-degrading endonuclease RelE of RelBE toxin-antitoxin system